MGIVHDLIAMFFKLVIVILVSQAAAEDLNFTYNGFLSANLSLDGVAQVTSNGLLKLTNDTGLGHAFYPNPVTFKNSSNATAFSFSTTFVFAIRSRLGPRLGGHGIAFVIAPTRGLPGGFTNQYLGVFNDTNNGNANNHIFAVELDSVQHPEFGDINNNHVGIDINGLRSVKSTPAGYHSLNNGGFRNLTLISGQPMQVWVEYDGIQKQINVTLGPINVDKPHIPLLSLKYDLSTVLNTTMYVGFSSTPGSLVTSHYVLGWSFEMNGQAPELVLSQLPKLPRIGRKKISNFLTLGVPVMSVSLVLLAISSLIYAIRRKKKFAELLEDWELEYGPQRFKYKELYMATKGFREKELLGSGGFGKVYKGILPSSKTEIAVKRVSHESRQGMKEFVAEIISIGRLRHRNLAPLLGYCRRKGELLLVYDYMPNGSLDKYLYDQPVVTLNWRQRFRVIKGVASGLFYLHEEWEQVVVHRDVKASNILLDSEFNARLGDFGLARLYDHGKDPKTTRIVGTFGYLAPENARLGRATTHADVFSFGAFLLEVACGRRPIQTQGQYLNVVLVDLVFSCWKRSNILEAIDLNLGSEFVAEEVELVLKLGLLCSHSEPSARPSMRQVVHYLEDDIPLPELSSLGLSSGGLNFAHREGFDDSAMSYPSSMGKEISYVPESTLLSGGR
ncbi:PREDICTED: L-type lectin-domain [Prunus dulcis]|uniref:non-specific serine/threonine protein kinase n=1 Tax=Prunus dulcis TaxID=3755 RepID=A0A5E4FKX6_PRUDU|nr:L-type lectin-domain containing receptor kinase IV.1-like [Prunus dulcis]XP_034219804.1 L-type lectin-domain containing receptor kinase IV.1-like [Prunus dulcis]VVA28753.1 PREDICTED: L-type lectin-domain [Prunus dulcis]